MICMTIKIKNIAIAALMTTLISGCATKQYVLLHEPAGRFTSIMDPEQLSNCIERNTDTWGFSSYFTNVKEVDENHYEIDISSKRGPYANINVTPYKSENSIAIFRFPFAGIVAKSQVNLLTKRCA